VHVEYAATLTVRGHQKLLILLSPLLLLHSDSGDLRSADPVAAIPAHHTVRLIYLQEYLRYSSE